jgi:formylglycine-generating enzyme required for sulfatase activity
MLKKVYIVFITLLNCLTIGHAQTNSKDPISPEGMKLIPGGPFLMGSNDGPEDEKPQHSVLIKPFFLDILPVSNADFAKFLSLQGLKNQQGETFYDHQDSDARIHWRNSVWQADSSYERHPANEVSWVGAQDYCAWLNKRLPTEAEWEKAARGTDGRKYPWGNTAPNAKLALFGAPYNASAPVDNFLDGASPYGILDMAGNQ